MKSPTYWFTVILLALGWKAVLCNSGCSQNDSVWCIRLESRTQLSHSFSAFIEPELGVRCWALNETISANSLITCHLKWSPIFLQIAWQAAELKESRLSWLLWVLLVSLFQVARRRQVHIIFGGELLLQSYKGMTSGGKLCQLHSVPGPQASNTGLLWEQGPSVIWMSGRAGVTWPYCLSLIVHHPQRGPDWVSVSLSSKKWPH